MENSEELLVALAKKQLESKRKKKSIIEKYYKIKFADDSIWDTKIGAIYFYDEDSVLQKYIQQEHEIFKIFDIDCIEPHRKYTCNMNDRIILRGPDNYYFGFCYLGDLDISCEEIVTTLKKVMIFVKNAKNNLKKKEYNYENILDLKMMLAILDILRNSLLTNLFFFLMKENQISDIYIYELGENLLANEIFELLLRVERKLIDIIIYQKSDLLDDIHNMLNNFIELQNKVINELLVNNNFYQNDLYIRYRKSREADNILDNVLCLNYALDEILNNNPSNLDGIYIFGMNYGSIELSCIARVILEQKNINVTVGNIMKKFRKVYVESSNKQKNIENLDIKRNASYILIDENIMTGATLTNAKKYLEKFNLKEIDSIIIQFPTVARFKNIVDRIEEKDYIELLKKIKGMIVPENYSKLCEYRSDFIFPYMDKLGNFDLYKSDILKNLYKNGEYIHNSAVSRISEYYKERFI